MIVQHCSIFGKSIAPSPTREPGAEVAGLETVCTRKCVYLLRLSTDHHQSQPTLEFRLRAKTSQSTWEEREHKKRALFLQCDFDLGLEDLVQQSNPAV